MCYCLGAHRTLRITLAPVQHIYVYETMSGRLDVEKKRFFFYSVLTHIARNDRDKRKMEMVTKKKTEMRGKKVQVKPLAFTSSSIIRFVYMYEVASECVICVYGRYSFGAFAYSARYFMHISQKSHNFRVGYHQGCLGSEPISKCFDKGKYLFSFLMYLVM